MVESVRVRNCVKLGKSVLTNNIMRQNMPDEILENEETDSNICFEAIQKVGENCVTVLHRKNYKRDVSTNTTDLTQRNTNMCSVVEFLLNPVVR